MKEPRKKLTIVHGDKGGVGKSTLAAAIADAILEQYGRVAIIEGDEKIDDVAARFAEVPGVKGFTVDLARPDASEEAVIGLFDEIEAGGLPDHVVINTPASASATLDKQAGVLIEAAHDLGYEVCVAWLLGPDESSAALSTESALCRLADRKVAVVNGRFGDGKRFAWTKHPARTAWLESGGLESVLPALTDRAMTAISDQPGRYSTLAGPDSPLSTITRKYVHQWVRAAWDGPVRLLLED